MVLRYRYGTILASTLAEFCPETLPTGNPLRPDLHDHHHAARGNQCAFEPAVCFRSCHRKERLYQHDTISAMELIGDLGDINKVKAMLRELLDGAKLVIVEGGFQLVLKPLVLPK